MGPKAASTWNHAVFPWRFDGHQRLECVMTRSFKLFVGPVALAKSLALAIYGGWNGACRRLRRPQRSGGRQRAPWRERSWAAPSARLSVERPGWLRQLVDAAESRTVVVPADTMPTGTIVQQRVIVLDPRMQAAWNRCASLYKTFNPNTGEFIGEDGLVHICQ